MGDSSPSRRVSISPPSSPPPQRPPRLERGESTPGIPPDWNPGSVAATLTEEERNYFKDPAYPEQETEDDRLERLEAVHHKVMDINQDLITGFSSWRAVLFELVEIGVFSQNCCDLIKLTGSEGKVVSHLALAYLYQQGTLGYLALLEAFRRLGLSALSCQLLRTEAELRDIDPGSREIVGRSLDKQLPGIMYVRTTGLHFKPERGTTAETQEEVRDSAQDRRYVEIWEMVRPIDQSIRPCSPRPQLQQAPMAEPASPLPQLPPTCPLPPPRTPTMWPTTTPMLSPPMMWPMMSPPMMPPPVCPIVISPPVFNVTIANPSPAAPPSPTYPPYFPYTGSPGHWGCERSCGSCGPGGAWGCKACNGSGCGHGDARVCEASCGGARSCGRAPKSPPPPPPPPPPPAVPVYERPVQLSDGTQTQPVPATDRLVQADIKEPATAAPEVQAAGTQTATATTTSAETQTLQSKPSVDQPPVAVSSSHTQTVPPSSAGMGTQTMPSLQSVATVQTTDSLLGPVSAPPAVKPTRQLSFQDEQELDSNGIHRRREYEDQSQPKIRLTKNESVYEPRSQMLKEAKTPQRLQSIQKPPRQSVEPQVEPSQPPSEAVPPGPPPGPPPDQPPVKSKGPPLRPKKKKNTCDGCSVS